MNAALIPVRGNSRGIPDKNIRLVGGRPLLYWSVKAACECPELDVVYVSTDSDKISSTAMRFGFDKLRVIGRPPSTATDTASTESVLTDFAMRYDFDSVALIQATSPLITCDDLSGGFRVYERPGIDSVLSVVRQKRFIWSAQPDGTGRPINYSPSQRPRRQEYDGFLVENGAFYITSRELLVASGVRISGNIGFYEMPPESYTEVDEENDLTVVDALLRSRPGRKRFSINDVKMFITDCDGCMTDGGMYYGEQGETVKKFNTRDGMAFELLKKAGILTGIITSEKSGFASARGRKLSADVVVDGAKDKLSGLLEICGRFGIGPENVVYLGDDINDLPCILKAGMGCCVADAADAVKDAADHITAACGGHGAIREIADMLVMQAKQKTHC